MFVNCLKCKVFLTKPKKLFAEKTNDIKKIVGVFPSNFVTRFKSFHSMLIKSGTQYPFVIINAD